MKASLNSRIVVSFSFFLFLFHLVQSRVGTVSWGYGRIDVFVRNVTDSTLWHVYYDNSHWYPFEQVGANFSAGPCACSWGWGRLDLFINGYLSNSSTDIFHNSYDYTKNGPGWSSNWDQWGSNIASPIGCFSDGYGKIQIAGVGTNSAVYVRNFTNSSWINLGGSLTANPPGIFRISPNFYIFATDLNNHNLTYKIVDANYGNITNWTTTSDQISYSPAVTAWTNTRMDIFYVGYSDGKLYQKTVMLVGNTWDFKVAAVCLNGSLISAPSVASWGYGRFDVFAVGSGYQLSYISYDLCNGGWSEWQTMGTISIT